MMALTTPTGNIGSKVFVRLLETETSAIRVLVRDPGKLPALARERVEIVQGSMEDLAALRRLLDGVESLFWCQPDAATATDYVGAYEALARIGAEAIRETDVQRVVAISATGEPGDTPAGPITALHRMESILAETGAAVRFLRCGSFFENLLWQWESILEQGWFTYPAPRDVSGPQVATADIAHAAAGWLANADWTGQKAVALLGPQDLTYDEMATILSHAVGRPVRYQESTPQEYLVAMQAIGQSESAAQGLVDMFTYLARHYAVPPEVDRLLTPTHLADWLEQF